MPMLTLRLTVQWIARWHPLKDKLIVSLQDHEAAELSLPLMGGNALTISIREELPIAIPMTSHIEAGHEINLHAISIADPKHSPNCPMEIADPMNPHNNFTH